MRLAVQGTIHPRMLLFLQISSMERFPYSPRQLSVLYAIYLEGFQATTHPLGYSLRILLTSSTPMFAVQPPVSLTINASNFRIVHKPPSPPAGPVELCHRPLLSLVSLVQGWLGAAGPVIWSARFKLSTAVGGHQTGGGSGSE